MNDSFGLETGLHFRLHLTGFRMLKLLFSPFQSGAGPHEWVKSELTDFGELIDAALPVPRVRGWNDNLQENVGSCARRTRVALVVDFLRSIGAHPGLRIEDYEWEGMNWNGLGVVQPRTLCNVTGICSYVGKVFTAVRNRLQDQPQSGFISLCLLQYESLVHLCGGSPVLDTMRSSVYPRVFLALTIVAPLLEMCRSLLPGIQNKHYANLCGVDIQIISAGGQTHPGGWYDFLRLLRDCFWHDKKNDAYPKMQEEAGGMLILENLVGQRTHSSKVQFELIVSFVFDLADKVLESPTNHFETVHHTWPCLRGMRNDILEAYQLFLMIVEHV
jgi:hypothetical protein